MRKLDADDAINEMVEVLTQADENFIQRIAEQVLAGPVQVGNSSSSDLLFPGRYSVFVLRDDGSWEQPTYEITESMSESEFRRLAEADCGGFISYGVGDDEDCPDENVRTF